MAEGGTFTSPAGGVFLSEAPLGQAAWTSVPIFGDQYDHVAGQHLVHDKTWLTVDHEKSSPYRGSIYATVSLRRITPCKGGTYESPDNTICFPDEAGARYIPLGSQLQFAFSRDGGRTFSLPAVVDNKSFAGFVAVEPSGAVDLIDVHASSKFINSGTVIVQRRSTDGGATFGEPTIIVRSKEGEVVGLPTVAVRPTGDLMICWQQGRLGGQRSEIRCATRTATRPWSKPAHVRFAGEEVVGAWPAVVGTSRRWYLLLYLVGRGRTEVALLQSADGTSFSRVSTLRAVDGLGRGEFCTTLWEECARENAGRTKFLPGHYITISASKGRLAAAYVLPADGSGTKAAVYVTTLREPPPN